VRIQGIGKRGHAYFSCAFFLGAAFDPSLALKGAHPFGVPENEATKSYVCSVDALMFLGGFSLDASFSARSIRAIKGSKAAPRKKAQEK